MQNVLIRSLKLWDISTGKEVPLFQGYTGWINSVAFSPDGKYLITGTWWDNTVRLLEAETGKEIWAFEGHSGFVNAVAFSPDGQYILSGSKDNSVRLLDISKRKEVRTYKGHSGSVNTVAFSPDGKYALTGDASGSIILWDVATGAMISMTVAFSSGEWIVITPEGYFNASKNGPSQLSARMGVRVFGLEQFYDVFYRPDIVQSKMKGEDITALTSTNLEEALKNPPPLVEFVSVPSETSEGKVNISYKVASTGGGIGEIRLFHNGKLVQSDGYYREAKAPQQGTATLLAYNGRAIKDEMRSITISSKEEKKLSLIESAPKGDIYEGAIVIDAISGENDIGLAAFNRNNTVQSLFKTVTFRSTLTQDDPHLYILSVGIDEYRSFKDNLKYAVKDAESIAHKLKEESLTKYKPENIHIDILKSKETSKGHIVGSINALSKIIKPYDVFVLFIASHGVLQGGLYSIVTSDYNGELTDKVLISSNEIMEISKNMKALTQIYILDTCHAGGLDNFVSGLYDARMTVLARNMGLHMFASASSTQEALDGYKGENGMFTYALLDGLNNNRNADSNRDGIVSIYELGTYAKTQTIKSSKEAGHSQTPMINNFGKDIGVYVIQ